MSVEPERLDPVDPDRPVPSVDHWIGIAFLPGEHPVRLGPYARPRRSEQTREQ